MKYIFSVEGNIGSGKSTLLKHLKERFVKIIYLQEPIDTWNEIKDSMGVTILEKYYQDQKKYSFSFQMMAFITRLTLLKDTLEKSPEGTIILTERCLYTDREIFAKMLYDAKLIEEIEYTIYLKWFDYFIKDCPITGIIYIRTTPDLCSNRVFERNRKGETIPLDYLAECHRYHEDWIKESSQKVLIVNDNECYDTIYNFIKSSLNNSLKDCNSLKVE